MKHAIKPGDTLSAARFLLVNPQSGTSRAGAPYLRCLLRNSDGDVSARSWSFDVGRLSALTSSGVVEVDGEVQEWQGGLQISITDISPVTCTEAEIVALMPQSRHDVQALFAEVRTRLLQMKCPQLRSLAESFLDDESLMHQMREAPAGVRMHHAWIGGLLEHTRSVMRLVDAVIDAYIEMDGPVVDRDLVVLGAFLHDLGKTFELSWVRGFAYTEDGDLIGHIVRGAMLIEDKVAEIEMSGGQPPSPEQVRHLQHLILSHHERPEYGAAKAPRTPEAQLLSLIDRLDATLHLNTDEVAIQM